MHGVGFSLRHRQCRSLAVGDKVQSAVLDVSHSGFVKAQGFLTRMVQGFGGDRMALGQTQDALHPAQMAQRILVGEKLIDELLDRSSEFLRLVLGVTDFETRHAEFVLGVMGIVGGELSDTGQSAMRRNRLAILAEDLHHLFGEPDSELLADIDKRYRVEVFLHLDMTIGMDFGAAPLAQLEARRYQGL